MVYMFDSTNFHSQSSGKTTKIQRIFSVGIEPISCPVTGVKFCISPSPRPIGGSVGDRHT